MVVLLVEDEAMVRNLCRKLLEIEGHSVLAAKDGREALSLARGYSGDIDLLLTDLRMPGMNGDDLAHVVCRERPSIRVLMISGQTSAELVAANERLPFLAKPFFPSQFQEKLRAVLAGPAGEATVI